MDPTQYVNKGIMSFGIELVQKRLLDEQKRFSYVPMISVGSGMGGFESLTPNINWILVDPDPMSYEYKNSDIMDKPIRDPDYKYVKDLLADKPHIKGNCTLFLNWCDPNYSMYDYEAVIQLQPLMIFTIVEIYMGHCGAAGGELFHDFVHTMRCAHPDPKYQIETEDTLVGSGNLDIRMLTIVRNEHVEHPYIQNKHPSKIYHPDPCLVM